MWEEERSKGYDAIPLEKTLLCPMEESVRSRDLGQETRVFFVNEASETVNLYWVDGEGVEQLEGPMLQNETHSVLTTEGHIFHARSAETNQLLVRHTVGLFEVKNPSNVPCATEPLTQVELHGDSELDCGFMSKGFVNKAGCEVNVYYYNGTGEELVGQMGTEQIPQGQEWDYTWKPSQFFEMTYLTHRFYVRMPDGRFVAEFRVTKAPIVDCPNPARQRQEQLESHQQLTFKTVTVGEQIAPAEIAKDDTLLAKAWRTTAGSTIREKEECDSVYEACPATNSMVYVPPIRLATRGQWTSAHKMEL